MLHPAADQRLLIHQRPGMISPCRCACCT
jgi:hypothetical protein